MENIIIQELTKKVAEMAGNGCKAAHKKVIKNNGIVRQAVVISGRGCVSPVIYIDNLLEDIGKGIKTVDTAAAEVVELYKADKDMAVNESISRLAESGRDYILDHVECQIVNAGRNAGMLADVPNRRIWDLAVVYRTVIADGHGRVESFLVNNKVMEADGISMEELEEAAHRNTEAGGFCINTMQEIIEKMTGIKDSAADGLQMYVLTNRKMINGAVAMLCAEPLAMAAEKLQEDFYIIPSSIHELLAVPVSQADPEDLKAMVKEINNTQVSPEEVLGYSVYRYDRKEGAVTVAS